MQRAETSRRAFVQGGIAAVSGVGAARTSEVFAEDSDPANYPKTYVEELEDRFDYRAWLAQIDDVLDEAKQGGQRGRAIFIRLVLMDLNADFAGIFAAMPTDDQAIVEFVLQEISRANGLRVPLMFLSQESWHP